MHEGNFLPPAEFREEEAFNFQLFSKAKFSILKQRVKETVLGNLDKYGSLGGCSWVAVVFQAECMI